MEVQLKGFKETHRPIWERQLEFSVIKVHLQAMSGQFNELAFCVVLVAKSVDLHNVVWVLTFVEVDRALFSASIA